MQICNEKEIIRLIKRCKTFEAQLEDQSLTVRVNSIQPCIGTAIHQGHRLRADLIDNCALSNDERRFEEDPFTGDFISSLPITLQVEDSRYEYDLNRPPEECIYEVAWEKHVWHRALSESQKQVSLKKHARYFRILKSLVRTLEEEFGVCVIYDIHSYNYQRLENHSPVFNLGTELVNMEMWEKGIDNLKKKLKKVTLPNIVVDAEINKVFFGRGFQARFIRDHFQESLVIPLEVKKIYMSELEGDPYPMVIDALKLELKRVFIENTAYIVRQKTGQRKFSALKLLSTDLSPEVIKVDRQLYSLARGIDTLRYLTPSNYRQEKRRFFKRNGNYEPQFRYRQLDVDPYQFRERLYRLPVEDIRDSSLHLLYRRTVDMLATRIDMITSIGTEEFFYNSLKYYGEPSPVDIRNAEFLLYGAKQEEKKETYDAGTARAKFLEAVKQYGIKCSVKVSSKIVSRALVNNQKKEILLNKFATFNETELNAVIHHELGIHIVTTANAVTQPLKILTLGLPGNTHTQEGLALLSEYQSGNLTLDRLKTLAHRVIAVHSMVKGQSFVNTYNLLREQYKANSEEAFTITTRVYRGGGFTKDFLYLNGLVQVLRRFREENLEALLVGKTSLEFLPILNELLTRKILIEPKYKPLSFEMTPPPHHTREFVLSSLR